MIAGIAGAGGDGGAGGASPSGAHLLTLNPTPFVIGYISRNKDTSLAKRMHVSQ